MRYTLTDLNGRKNTQPKTVTEEPRKIAWWRFVTGEKSVPMEFTGQIKDINDFIAGNYPFSVNERDRVISI